MNSTFGRTLFRVIPFDCHLQISSEGLEVISSDFDMILSIEVYCESNAISLQSLLLIVHTLLKDSD